MAKTLDALNSLNNFLRTLLAAAVVAGLSVAGWFGYTAINSAELQEQALIDAQDKLKDQERQLLEKEKLLTEKDKEIGFLNEEVQKHLKKIEQLDTALRLLKVDTRLAQITVLDQETDPETDELLTRIEFQEITEDGVPLGEPKIFRLQGDRVYVEHLIVKFEDKYIEQADLDRSTSIVLFRRIFGEHQKPSEGYVLDETDTAPTAYTRGGKMSDFEHKIWDDFWNIAHNPDKAKKMGIRAIHGDAVFTQLRPGKRYKLFLRASDGLSIMPAEDVKTPISPAS